MVKGDTICHSRVMSIAVALSGLLQRVARAEDIGPVIAFLASDEARWVTGDTIRVDGGSKL